MADNFVVAGKNANGVSTEFADAKAFGFVLREIIGKKRDDPARAAEFLGINPGTLRNILGGHQRPSKRILESGNWRSVFEKHYPNEWNQHRAVFEQEAQKLDVAGIRNGTKSPQKKDSLGYIVWSIIGGVDAKITLAAGRFQIKPKFFSRFLHNGRGISSKRLSEHNWRKVFEEHYPEGWRKYQNDFEKCISNSRAHPIRKKRPISKHNVVVEKPRQEMQQTWCEAAGKLIKESAFYKR